MHSLHKMKNSRPQIYKIIVKMNESKIERKEEWGKKHVLWPNFTQHKLDMTVMIELSQVLANEAVFMVGKRWHILAILIYHFLAPFWAKILVASQQEISLMSQTVLRLQSLQLNTNNYNMNINISYSCPILTSPIDRLRKVPSQSWNFNNWEFKVSWGIK